MWSFHEAPRRVGHCWQWSMMLGGAEWKIKKQSFPSTQPCNRDTRRLARAPQVEILRTPTGAEARPITQPRIPHPEYTAATLTPDRAPVSLDLYEGKAEALATSNLATSFNHFTGVMESREIICESGAGLCVGILTKARRIITG